MTATTAVTPKRRRRAVKLTVRLVGPTASGGFQYEVTGGAAPHTVLVEATGPWCDCLGYHHGARPCTHIRAVELAQTPESAAPAADDGALEQFPDDDEPASPDQEIPPLPDVPALEPPQLQPPPSPPLSDPPRADVPAPEPPAPEPLTDLGNARRFVRLYGADMRHVRNRRRWYYWRDRRWSEDETGEGERRAKAVIDALYAEAATEPDPGRQKAIATHALRSATAGRIQSMLELASTDARVALTGREFDAGPWLLNVLNGTLDLRTGELRPHDRAKLLTKLAAVNYDAAATAPRWTAFLTEIMHGDPELVAYLQRAAGYTLSGLTSEHVVFLLHGTGANGKTTFLETLRAAVGDYARQADFSTFLARRDDGPRHDIARLRGARLVMASEAAEGRRFDETLLKQLTGEDTVTARRLYQEAEEFRPQFKLWLAANHKPVVWGTDHAFWRRIRLVPFTVAIPPERQDKALRAKLADELPGILAWMVAGCRAWQAQGLAEPAAVTAATRAYHDEQDLIGQFLADRCVLSTNGTRAAIEQKALYTAYEAWCGETGTEVLGVRKFNDRVRERGIAELKSHGTRLWKGVALTGTSAPAAEDDDAPPF